MFVFNPTNFSHKHRATGDGALGAARVGHVVEAARRVQIPGAVAVRMRAVLESQRLVVVAVPPVLELLEGAAGAGLGRAVGVAGEVVGQVDREPLDALERARAEALARRQFAPLGASRYVQFGPPRHRRRRLADQ